MKAILVKQTGGPEVMELVDLPVPEPKANDAVVKLAAVGVNFVDVYFREGRYKAQVPFIPGQEGAGTVVAVGKDVKSVKIGDRVAWTATLGCYAEYAAVAADRLVAIPLGVSDQRAAATMLQGMTAHYLAYDSHRPTKGETARVELDCCWSRWRTTSARVAARVTRQKRRPNRHGMRERTKSFSTRMQISK